MLYNIAYGPFQRSAFFKLLQEASLDISASMGCNDALLLLYWPSICEDLNYTGDATNDEARKRYLKDLPAMAPGCIKGPKCSIGRF